MARNLKRRALTLTRKPRLPDEAQQIGVARQEFDRSCVAETKVQRIDEIGHRVPRNQLKRPRHGEFLL
jgi:hypothetical protein